jgi:hypothetical protein
VQEDAVACRSNDRVRSERQREIGKEQEDGNFFTAFQLQERAKVVHSLVSAPQAVLLSFADDSTTVDHRMIWRTLRVP